MKIRLGFFFGGRSVEHEISVITALQAIAAINENKYEVIPVYVSKEGKWYTGSDLLNISIYKDPEELLKKCDRIIVSNEYNDFKLIRYKRGLKNFKVLNAIDIALPVMHGTYGEDGSIQGLFELMNIPYIGSNVISSALGMDKIYMKVVLKEYRIPTVGYTWFYSREWAKEKDYFVSKIEKEIGYPVIIKPANLGSSIGISPAKDRGALETAVELASKFSTKVLVEKMIEHLREINCSVLGDYEDISVSECEEPIKTGELLTYEDKYISRKAKGTQTLEGKGMSNLKREVPAKLSKDHMERIKSLAKETFKVLGCAGVARIDFLIDTVSNEVFVNEINTIPGSLSFYLWDATKKSFPDLLETLVHFALKTHREKNNLSTHFDTNIFNVNVASVKLSRA